MSGSPYGRRAWGAGPYSAFNDTGTADVAILEASRTRFAGAGAIRQRFLAAAIGSPTLVLEGIKLWSAIYVPPCQPWLAIGNQACSQALPNNAGAMFP